jgi:hypothetical protein
MARAIALPIPAPPPVTMANSPFSFIDRLSPFLVPQEIIKASAPSEDLKKLTAEYAETAELFLYKGKKGNHFMDMDSSLHFDPTGIETRE